MIAEVTFVLGIILLLLVWFDLFVHEVPAVRRLRGWIAAAATLLLFLSRFGKRGSEDDEEPRTFGPSVDLPDPKERFDHQGSIDETEAERQRPMGPPVDVDLDDDLDAFRAAAKQDGVLSGDVGGVSTGKGSSEESDRR